MDTSPTCRSPIVRLIKDSFPYFCLLRCNAIINIRIIESKLCLVVQKKSKLCLCSSHSHRVQESDENSSFTIEEYLVVITHPSSHMIVQVHIHRSSLSFFGSDSDDSNSWYSLIRPFSFKKILSDTSDKIYSIPESIWECQKL